MKQIAIITSTSINDLENRVNYILDTKKDTIINVKISDMITYKNYNRQSGVDVRNYTIQITYDVNSNGMKVLNEENGGEDNE